MKVHPEGHIVGNYDPTYDDIIHRLEENRDHFLEENNKLITRFVNDARIGKTVPGKAKKKIGVKRILKYLQDLKKLDKYFEKPLDKLTEEDLQKFILNLEEGKFQQKTRNGTLKAYKPETQVGIKKVIKKFYRWLYGNNRFTPDIVNWIDTSIEVADYRVVSKEQVDAMLSLMTSTTPEKIVRNRAILMVLFDSGVRADELVNIRLQHLSFENGNYKVRIEFSKTKKRTISLPFCKKYIDEWLEIHPMRTQNLAQLFPVTYEQLAKIIRRVGNHIRVKITPHSMRHASATYWCRHLTPYELCYRFGWSMSSKMPQRYIDRTGVYQEKAEKIIKSATVEQLQTENAVLNRRIASMEDMMTKLFGNDMDEARKIIEIAKNELEKNKDLRKL